MTPQPWGGSPLPSGLETSVENLLYAGLRIAGITLAPGRGPSADQLTDALNILRRMISRWNIEPLMVYKVATTQVAVQPGQQSYAVGTGGDWELSQQSLERVNWVSGDTRQPVDILTWQLWSEITDPLRTGDRVEKVYLDRTHPLAVLYTYPTVTGAGTLELYTKEKLPQITATTDVVDLPDGYEEAIVYNLAIRLATQFPTQQHILAEAGSMAQSALAAVRRRNLPKPTMRTDLPGVA